MTGWTPGQVLLRILILTGPLLALYATALVGPAPAGLLVALTAVLSVAFAAMAYCGAGTTSSTVWAGEEELSRVDVFTHAPLSDCKSCIVARMPR